MDKPDVFMPLYIGDYLAGTSRLTTELHGAYMLLIMDYWMNGPLPDDDNILASIAKMNVDAWSNARAMLEKFFSVSEGSWKHKRIEEEIAEAYRKKQAAKDKAEKAAAARWGNKDKSEKKAPPDASGNASSTPQAKHDECPSPSPSPVEPKGSRESAAEAPPPAVINPPKPAKSKRGTRLPDDWTLTNEYLEAAKELRPELLPIVETVAASFADYWHAKTGQSATKCDWLATWRNWLRNEKTTVGGPNATNKPASHQSYAERRADITDAVTNYERATNF